MSGLLAVGLVGAWTFLFCMVDVSRKSQQLRCNVARVWSIRAFDQTRCAGNQFIIRAAVDQLRNSWPNAQRIWPTAADARRLNGHGWLSDTHMTLASKYLQQQFPHIGGLYDTVLQQRFQWSKPGGPGYVQIFNVNGNHWVVPSNMLSGAGDVIDIFDSANVTYSSAALNVFTRFHRSPSSPVTIRVQDVQQQPNQYDCGPYVLAFATALAHKHDPTLLHFTNPRAHLQTCFQECTMSPFPAQDRQLKQDSFCQLAVEVFCVCRGMDDGSRMIACDSCREWFHQACVLGRGVHAPKGEWQCHACSG